jgi:hypothetical protein
MALGKQLSWQSLIGSGDFDELLGCRYRVLRA